MSQITHEDIVKLGDLALLDLKESEKQNLANSINSILGYVSSVAEADLTDVRVSQKFTDIARGDVEVDAVGSHELVMSNARQVSLDSFVEVSKVINK